MYYKFHPDFDLVDVLERNSTSSSYVLRVGYSSLVGLERGMLFSMFFGQCCLSFWAEQVVQSKNMLIVLKDEINCT